MSAVTALVAGEALLDHVRDAEGRVVSRPGGSPANVAVGLARLGVRTELLTTLGSDPAGRELRTHLADSGVMLRSPAAPPPATTASARAVLDADGAASYTFDLEWDPGSFTPGNADLLHSGSLAMMVEPGSSQVFDAFTSAASRTVLSLDPNVRPSLGISAEEVLRKVEQYAAIAHLLKLSDEDLAWLSPRTAVETTLTRLHRIGVPRVVVTRGARGCTLSTREGRLDLEAPRAEVVDTIGAGDSFMSGFLAALLTSGGREDLLAGSVPWPLLISWARTAMRSAAITVSRAGAHPPWADELWS